MKKLLNKLQFYLLVVRFIAIYKIMLLRWLVSPREKNKIARVIACSSMFSVLNNSVTTVGTPDLKADLIIVNHCSMLDIVMLESLYTIDVCWVGKDELKGKLGIISPMQYPNHITIDRSSKSSMLSLIKHAKKAKVQGRPIVIFPEGTRNKTDTLLPFKDGAKALAQILQAKIQPIVITGSKESVNFSKHSINSKVPITIQYLPTLQITKEHKGDETWYKNLYETMNNAFQEETNKLKSYI